LRWIILSHKLTFMEDKDVQNIIKKEEERQKGTLNMIPSENHTSSAVREVLSSVLGDKYAEGYPQKRYYGGNKYIDELEELCRERAKNLFGVPYVNVQGYSGSPANHAVYFALLEPGDKVMGMSLLSGGHLTHGWKVNFSGKYYESVFYGVDKDTELIDYEEVRKTALKEKPKMIICGATSYPRLIDFKRFREIADEVGAYLCADISHIAGLVVSGVHPDPTPYAHVVTTTTHKTLRGPRGAIIMVTHSGVEKDKNMGEKIDKAVFPGLQGGPHENSIAAIAVCLREATDPSFIDYGKQVVSNCRVFAEEIKKSGFRVVSGGTDNHLLLVDLQGREGIDAQSALEDAGIMVNKNTIPFDENPPFNPSGIRLGTPALTSRGMKEGEMKEIAFLVSQTLMQHDLAPQTYKRVEEICEKFPII